MRPWKKCGLGVLLCLCLSTGVASAARGLVCYQNDWKDGGFNEGAYNGAQRAAKTYKQLELRNVVSKEDSDASRKNLKELKEEWDFVIGVGGVYLPILEAEAKAHPLTKYIVLDTSVKPTRSNVRCVKFSDLEAGYLAGVTAAAATTTKHIGFIGYDKENVHSKAFLAGFTVGSIEVDPLVKIKTKWVKSYNRPDKMEDIAEDLYDSKYDVIFGAAGASNKGLEAAAIKKQGLMIGCDLDQLQQLPYRERNHVLNSVVKNLDGVTYDSIKACLNNKFVAGLFEANYNNGGIILAENKALQSKFPKVNEAILDAEAQLTLGQAELPVEEERKEK